MFLGLPTHLLAGGIKIPVNLVEIELLRRVGTVTVAPGADCVLFEWAPGLTMEQLISEMERAIQFQESDQGCWQTAKQWRDAKSGLLSKIRQATLRAVQSGD